MALDASQALQAAIYSTLSRALTSASLAGEQFQVFDHVPEEKRGKYVVIGDADVGDWGTKDSIGTEQLVEISIYDYEYRGRKEVRRVAGLVYEALHERELDIPIDGAQLVVLRFDSSNFPREPDGLTYKATQRFRALLDHACGCDT